MRIGIDARLIEETGVGRYIRHLIDGLGDTDKAHSYVVFLRKKSYASFALPNGRWKKVCADVPWHGLEEQISMPWYFLSEHLDLLHIPYHNPPILYPGKMVLTVHDLTILHMNTGKATTLPYALYALKRLLYRIELGWGLIRAAMVIAVSEATKRDVVNIFHIPSGKIQVTYEGVAPIFFDAPTHVQAKRDPYILYVGNAYPHKNLHTLVGAFSRIVKKHPSVKLVLVGRDDFFYRRLKREVTLSSVAERVVFHGPADDRQLIGLYAGASLLVMPSKREGFGLPPLEALASGCPVACSDIPVFHETLADHATYFDPTSADDMARVIADRLTHPASLTEIRASRTWVARYSWNTMVRDTRALYERCARL
jgi:glycosyltransferase involved in cell wall biosynthesis